MSTSIELEIVPAYILEQSLVYLSNLVCSVSIQLFRYFSIVQVSGEIFHGHCGQFQRNDSHEKFEISYSMEVRMEVALREPEKS